MDGCGDGSWTDPDGNILQFFKCPHGKGLFYPVHSLQPLSKFSSQPSRHINCKHNETYSLYKRDWSQNVCGFKKNYMCTSLIFT